MAWSTPITAVANAAFTAAQFNASVRDNLNATAPGRASAAGQMFFVSGANQITGRAPVGGYVQGTGSFTTTGTWLDMPGTFGPQVTVTTGARVMVIVSAQLRNEDNNWSWMGYAISGATNSSAVTYKSVAIQSGPGFHPTVRYSNAYMEMSLNPGSHTFTAKYRIDGGTGAIGQRTLIVIPM